MQVVITFDDQKDGLSAARVALAGQDLVIAIEEALNTIREKIKYGSEKIKYGINLDQSEVEHEAFMAGVDFGRTAILEALEGRGLLDLVIA